MVGVSGRGGSRREDFVDVGGVHFEAVLVLVDVAGHVLEVAGGVEGGGGFLIDGEVA